MSNLAHPSMRMLIAAESDTERIDRVAVTGSIPAAGLDRVRLLGVSFRTSSLLVRSVLSFTSAGLAELLHELQRNGCSECLVLSTCNRTEVYFTEGEPEDVLKTLSRSCEMSVEEIAEACYSVSGKEAVHHLFRVAAGLDSALVGEHEILGQLKAAHEVAKGQGTIGRVLGPLLQRSLHASKRVRTESDLNRNVTCVGGMAIRHASKLAGGLSGKRMLLIGAGQIAERIAKELMHAKGLSVSVCNRTFNKAQKLASLYGFKAVPFEDLDAALDASDIVISAVATNAPPLNHERLRAGERTDGLVVVDLGVPPNVDTSNLDLSKIRLVDMDAIVEACRVGSQSRLDAVPKAEFIVSQESNAFCEEVVIREAGPTIEALVKMGEEVRKRNLDWAFGQKPDASEQDRKLLEDLSIRMVRGMLEAPIQALKFELREPVEREVLARLFRLKVA